MYRALRNRNALVLFSSWFVSKIGDYFFLATFPVWLLELTRTPVAGGIATSIDLVPVLLLGALAGALSDRWNRFRTLIAADLIRAVAMLMAVAALFLPSSLAIPVIMAALVILSSAGLFFAPSKSAMSIRLLPKELVTPYTSLVQTMDNAMRIVVPLGALALYGLLGALPSFVIDACSFFVSAGLLMFLPNEGRVWQSVTNGRQRTVWADMGEGFRYVRDNRTLMVVLVVVMVMFAGAGATGPLQPYFVQKALGLEPRMTGVLATFQGAGMIAGALLASATHKKFAAQWRLSVGLLGVGLGSVLFGFSPTLWTAAAVCVFAGASLALVINGLTTLLLSTVPESFIGRIGGLLGTGQVAVQLVSATLGPVLAMVLPLAAVYSFMGVCIFVSGLSALLLLRQQATNGEPVAEAAP